MPNTLISKAQIAYRAKWARKYSRENKRCGEIVRKALLNIQKAHCERADAPCKPYRHRSEYETAVTDLLANIRHFCDAKGLDFGCLDNDAYGHYSVEVVQARTGVTQ